MLSREADSTIRVAIVEHDLKIRERLAASIRLERTITLVASLGSVSAAMEWMSTSSADVLITDLALPDGSGLEVIKACACRHPHCDILVVTDSDHDHDLVSCILAGAVGYVVKRTFDQANLGKVIRALKAGESPLSPSIARKLIQILRNGSISLPTESIDGKSALTAREVAILNLIAKGFTYEEVAEELLIAVGTVQNHIKAIYRKLSVNSRGRAVFEATRRGLLTEQHGFPSFRGDVRTFM